MQTKRHLGFLIIKYFGFLAKILGYGYLSSCLMRLVLEFKVKLGLKEYTEEGIRGV